MSEPSKRGSNGGNARAAKLTKEQRSAIAKKAAAKRWGKKDKVEDVSIVSAPPLPESGGREPSINGIIPIQAETITTTVHTPPQQPIVAPQAPAVARTPSTSTPAERGRRRASKEKAVSKVYRQALSTAEKEYAETVEALAYHDEMAARLKAKLPRLIQTIRALGGTIDPQAELLQSRQTTNYPVDPSQNLPNPIDPALFQTNSGPLPGLVPAAANAPVIPNMAAGGAMDLDYIPKDDEEPEPLKTGKGWV